MIGTCDVCGAECEVYPCPACDEFDEYEDCTCFDPDLCADCWRKATEDLRRHQPPEDDEE